MAVSTLESALADVYETKGFQIEQNLHLRKTQGTSANPAFTRGGRLNGRHFDVKNSRRQSAARQAARTRFNSALISISV